MFFSILLEDLGTSICFLISASSFVGGKTSLLGEKLFVFVLSTLTEEHLVDLIESGNKEPQKKVKDNDNFCNYILQTKST